MKRLYPLMTMGFLSLLIAPGAYGNGGCGNKSAEGTSGKPNCCSKDSSSSIPCAADPIEVFTGNEYRETADLRVWGGAGEIPLVFIRYAHSRYSAYPRPFGLAHNWNHSFHYTMYDDGVDDQGRARIVIHFPEGNENVFTQDATDLALWLPLPGVNKRLFQSGNSFFLQMSNGHRYHFEKIVNPNGNVWPYESNTNVYYQLQDIRDSYQNLYTLNYDDEHWLTRVTEPGGRYLEITYAFVNGWRVITRVGTSDGRSVQYKYDLFHDEVHSWIRDWVRLVGVDYGDGTHAQYEYWQSEPGKGPNLEHAIDPRYTRAAVNMKYTYNTSITEGYIKEERNGITGAVMATLTSGFGYRTVCYPNGRVQKYIQPDELLGNTTSYTDGLGRTTNYSYGQDGLGFLIALTDALGRVTTYTRTVYGNPLEIVYPDGSKENWTRDDLDLVLTHTDELGRVTTVTRDANHRMTRIDYPDATNEQYSYNGFGQVLTYTRRNGGTEINSYDSRGLRTSVRDALGNTTYYSYDAADHVAFSIDAKGNIMGKEFNERGLVTKEINADKSFRTYTYDEFGNLATVTNELKHVWETTYDEFKRPLFIKDPLNRITNYNYDLPGGICGCTNANNKPTQIVSPGGKITKIEYDVEWGVISMSIGAGTADASTTFYEYDGVGNLHGIIDPYGRDSIFDHDSRDRLISVTDPLRHKIQWIYDKTGNVVYAIRADGGTTQYMYDNMDRKIQTIDPKGQITKMIYDREGNITSLTDPNNNNYYFSYDLLSRLTDAIYPGGLFEAFSYDSISNLITYTTRTGNVRTYAYDNRNRVTSSTWSDNTPTINNTYDDANRLITLSNSVSLLTYTYNAANELLSEKQAITGVTGPEKTISYSYNPDGFRNDVTYPQEGTKIIYDYTGRNQISAMSANGIFNSVMYAYDLNGNRVSKVLKNGNNTVYAYDEINRLLSVSNRKGSGTFARFDYGYDNVNRKTFVRRNNDKGDVLHYDAIDQVTDTKYDVSDPAGAANNPMRVVNYEWDAAGNRINVTENGISTIYVTNNQNEYTQVGDVTLTSNEDGDLRTYNGWIYTYDAKSRLTVASRGDTTVTFSYDSRNRCVKRIINEVATYFYYDGWNVIEETNNDGIITAEYLNGAQVDEILEKITTKDTIVYHYDAVGNVTQLTNVPGNIIEQYHYDIFGVPTIIDSSGNTLTVSAYNNYFMFTGREYIPGINLYNYRNRMYSPGLGRFIQQDPLRFKAGDYNLYRYASNNPLSFLDPYGLADDAPDPNVPKCKEKCIEYQKEALKQALDGIFQLSLAVGAAGAIIGEAVGGPAGEAGGAEAAKKLYDEAKENLLKHYSTLLKACEQLPPCKEESQYPIWPATDWVPSGYDMLHGFYWF